LKPGPPTRFRFFLWFQDLISLLDAFPKFRPILFTQPRFETALCTIPRFPFSHQASFSSPPRYLFDSTQFLFSLTLTFFFPFWSFCMFSMLDADFSVSRLFQRSLFPFSFIPVIPPGTSLSISNLETLLFAFLFSLLNRTPPLLDFSRGLMFLPLRFLLTLFSFWRPLLISYQ